MASFEDEFLLAADKWLCDNYGLDIRYIAEMEGDSSKIICASISMYPRVAIVDNSFQISSQNIRAGQIQKYPVSKSELTGILQNAIQGKIITESLNLEIAGASKFDFYSERTHQNSWFSDLHLKVTGGAHVFSLATMSGKFDNVLRASNPPFDGIDDLVNWLGFGQYRHSNIAVIEIRVSPPVYLAFDDCSLKNDCLTLVIDAHEEFDSTQVGLAIRGLPGEGVASRMQVANMIEWELAGGGVKRGVAQIDIKNCDSAFVMLMIGSSTVRRQWFLDSTKARNNRYIAVQNFDLELRQIRRALFELPDADKFEKGIGALLFMLGFSPMLQLETDAPDLIVTTPGGQLIIIECTIKTSDFSEKLGKLVDRRGKLSKSLNDSGHQSEIFAALVTRSKKEETVSRDEELDKYRVSLITQEDIDGLFNQIRNPHDPDNIINDQKAKMDKKISL